MLKIIAFLFILTGCMEWPNEHVEIEFDMHHTQEHVKDNKDNALSSSDADLQKVQGH